MKREQFATHGLTFYAVSTLVGMAPMSIGTGVLVVALLTGPGGVGGFFQDLRQVSGEKWIRLYWKISLSLFAICMLSLLGTVIAPMGFNGETLRVDWVTDAGKLWYLLWPPVVVLAIRRAGKAGVWFALRAWVFTFIAFSVLGVAQYFTGWPRPQPIPYMADVVRYHVTLFLGHHLSVASIYIFPFFAALELSRTRQLPKAVGLAAVGLGGLALFFAHSKTLWIALPFGVALWIFLSLKKRTWAAVGAVIVIGFAAYWGNSNEVIRLRFADPFSMQSRGRLWEANWEFFKARPVLGVGWRKEHELSWMYLNEKYPGQDNFGGHAHNNVISAASTTGVLGLAAWVAWCVLSVVLLLPLKDAPGEFRRGLIAAWLVFHLNGMTQLNFWEGKVTHEVMLMMALALAWKSSERKSA